MSKIVEWKVALKLLTKKDVRLWRLAIRVPEVISKATGWLRWPFLYSWLKGLYHSGKCHRLHVQSYRMTDYFHVVCSWYAETNNATVDMLILSSTRVDGLQKLSYSGVSLLTCISTTLKQCGLGPAWATSQHFATELFWLVDSLEHLKLSQ